MQEGTHQLGAGRMVGRSPFRRHQVRQHEAEAARASQPRGSGRNHSPETCASSLCPPHTDRPGRGPRSGQQFRRTVGRSHRCLRQVAGAACGEEPERRGLPSAVPGPRTGRRTARRQHRAAAKAASGLAAVMRSAASTAALNRSTEAVVVGQSVA